jgi:aminoglycoside 3-N-acetyltransferase
MSQEPDAPIPPTTTSLAADLRALGLAAGMTLIVHSSLKAIADWVIGGPQAVILALETVLGEEGTLVMPTMSDDLTDPSGWENPPVPSTWWESIRQEMPAFMPDLTITRMMGIVPETFRKQNGVLRSSHPHASFAAWGKHAAWVTATHRLECKFGEETPLARIYDLEGYVLLVGVGHGNNSSLHLSEERATYPSKRKERYGAPILVDGQRQWVEFDTLDVDSDDFPLIGKDFARDTALVRQGKVGQATALLMPQRPLVDYGVRWIEQNRL